MGQCLCLAAYGQGEQFAVVVPLQVGNVAGLQQGIQLAEDMVGDLRLGEVEYELMALRGPWLAWQSEAPVRMLPVEIAVRADHLRLHP